MNYEHFQPIIMIIRTQKRVFFFTFKRKNILRRKKVQRRRVHAIENGIISLFHFREFLFDLMVWGGVGTSPEQ